ncbi:hypothetical protein [Pelolinea submarina]|uniref:hypothetical protein n=1 Tax=Pelolinea submarina TaxID=913107 RepID=UPI000F835370|nr:hypothetical protein [Pelolinea submarina]
MKEAFYLCASTIKGFICFYLCSSVANKNVGQAFLPDLILFPANQEKDACDKYAILYHSKQPLRMTLAPSIVILSP